MLNFDPSRIEAKREGRDILASIAGIPPQEAAKFFTQATHQNFRSSFNAFTSKYPDISKRISDARPDGVGPGEMIAWFIFDNLTLGGKSSPIDLMVDGKPFAEMKGGVHTKKSNTLDNFKITKDSDPSVSLILNDLMKFNTTHRFIFNEDLPGWDGITSIKVSSLALWENVNLSNNFSCLPRRKFIPIDPDGSIWNEDATKCIGNVSDHDIRVKLQALITEQVHFNVDADIDTLNKIVNRWKKQAFTDYITGKNIALVNTRTFEMHFFGEINFEMLGLYCVHRNQPWARIYLDEIDHEKSF